MKRKLGLGLIILVAVCCILYFIFNNSKDSNLYSNIPIKYQKKLDSALVIADTNADELKKAIINAPVEQKEAVAFLICYMPERDLKSLKSDYLLENVKYAYKAKEKFKWSKNIPNEIFLNDVLPYCSLNENRDNWRKDFYNRFSKYVDTTTNIFDAIKAINKNILNEVLVEYNVNREKPDQSPYESMRQNMASCSGLAILLTDALRAVGIPARVAGTPNWYDNSGNHNWTEIWADGKWYFTEYNSSKDLNDCWFISNAGQADENSREYSIYASSFKPAQTSFLLVWDTTLNYVHAENVTKRYIDVYKDKQKQQLNNSDECVQVKVNFIDKNIQNNDKRVPVIVNVFDSKGKIDAGITSDNKKDLNDYLVFILRKNNDYILKYNYDNKNMEYKLKLSTDNIIINLTN